MVITLQIFNWDVKKVLIRMLPQQPKTGNRKKKVNGNKPHNVNMIDLDPREEYQQEDLEPSKDLKETRKGSRPHQTTKIGTSRNQLKSRLW